MSTDSLLGNKVQCSNCQEFGHTKVRCKQPPVDKQIFDDGGFTGKGDTIGGDVGGADWESQAAHQAVAIDVGGNTVPEW